jgi:SAM-dependent methyltransferase
MKTNLGVVACSRDIVRLFYRGVIPRPMKDLLTRLRTRRIQQRYAPLSLAETFDSIYISNVWGTSDDPTLNSGLGSTGRYVEEYCALMRTLLEQYGVNSVTDVGCGNFNSGKTIAPFVALYTGVDIAQSVIDANTRIYAGERIRFTRADLTRDSLPQADAAIVRQVLQHLTNAEIKLALDNLLGAFPLVFITEHVYIGKGSRPNLDIFHGPGTRVPMKSGVFVDRRPFDIRAQSSGDIQCECGEVLRTWVVKGSQG